MINLILVVGLYVFVGNSGVFSFGSIGFAAIGAYTAGLLVIPSDQKAILQPDLPGFIAETSFGSVGATLMGGLVAALVAAAFAIPLMRLSGLAAGLATFAMLVIIRTVANSWTEVTNGAAGLSGIPVTTSKNAALLWALMAIVVGFAFQSTGLGLRLRGSREDDVAARSLGIGVRTERRVAWVVHGFIMGVGGGLYGQYLGSFNASFFYLALTFTTLAMLVVGGITSLSRRRDRLADDLVRRRGPAPDRAGRRRRGAPHPGPTWPARGGARDDHARDPDPPPARADERPRAAVAAAGLAASPEQPVRGFASRRYRSASTVTRSAGEKEVVGPADLRRRAVQDPSRTR